MVESVALGFEEVGILPETYQQESLWRKAIAAMCAAFPRQIGLRIGRIDPCGSL